MRRPDVVGSWGKAERHAAEFRFHMNFLVAQTIRTSRRISTSTLLAAYQSVNVSCWCSYAVHFYVESLHVVNVQLLLNILGLVDFHSHMPNCRSTVHQSYQQKSSVTPLGESWRGYSRRRNGSSRICHSVGELVQPDIASAAKICLVYNAAGS